MTVGKTLDSLPAHGALGLTILRRLAKARGRWLAWTYSGRRGDECVGCLVGHGAGLVEAGSAVVFDDDFVAAARLLPGRVEVRYMNLSIRFGDLRVGRAIEARASRLLAAMGAERDMADVAAPMRSRTKSVPTSGLGARQASTPAPAPLEPSQVAP